MKIKLRENLRKDPSTPSIWMKLGLLCCLCMLGITSVFAQTKSVTGKVVDEFGEPFPGATIQIKNTTTATMADGDGNFAIQAKSGDILLITNLGAKPQEIAVKNNSNFIKVVLSSDATMLGEVEVSVGYGRIKKRDLTGSIVSVRGEDLKTSPNSNAIKALQGKVAGLNVINSGGAGSSPDIKIRGIGTINASSNPLFVVDGMLLDNIDFVNPNDITSVEVLKDPSSLAIFGVQGANGVIIITTGRADKGKTKVKYDGYGGVQYLQDRDRLKLTNASEFTQLYNERVMNEYADAKNAAIASGQPIPAAPSEWSGDLLGKGTDWQAEIFRPAAITSHSISVSRADDKSSTLLSVGYFKQDGIVKYDSYQRLNANFAGDYKVNNAIKLGGNVNLSRWDSDPATASVGNAARALPTYAPYAPKEDWNDENIGSHYTPSPNIQKDVANPVAAMEIQKGTSESYGYRSVGNLYAEISFLKDFMFKTTGYYDVGVSYGSKFNKIFDVNNTTSVSSHKNEKSSFSRNTAEYTKYQADFILNYNKEIDKHRFGAMVGYTAHIKTEKGFNAGSDSIRGNEPNVIEDLWTINNGSPINRSAGDWFSDESFVSYISRINYSYANKYLLTATFRVDKSSKFSPKHRTGYFPSIGAGWIVSEESFMEPLKETVDFLKLKASWGKLGNDKIGNYLYRPQWNLQGQQVIIDGKIHYIPTLSKIVDPNIHWEIMEGFDVGIESSLFAQKLSVDLGFYTKTTKDLLAFVDVSAAQGRPYEVTNAGSIRNSGLEFVLSWKDKIGDLSYGVSVNGSTISNEVLSLGQEIIRKYNRTTVGQSVGAFYGYVQDGIFQTDQEAANYYPSPWTAKAGDIRYKDVNGDQKIDENDRTYIGSPLPNFVYGATLNLGYKSFDLSIDFNGVSGNKIVNDKKIPSMGQFNYYSTSLDRWHGENTSNSEPILNNQRASNQLPSTNLLESGAYFRIRGIQLGYNLPQTILKKLSISGLRVYANAQNILTFKKNSGYTPEIGGGILDGGIDSGYTYPLPTVYTAGVSLSF